MFFAWKLAILYRCNTLKELFSGKRDLFKGLWIDQSDWSWEQHPIIKIDMTLAAGSGNSAKSMQEKLLAQLFGIAAIRVNRCRST